MSAPYCLIAVGLTIEEVVQTRLPRKVGVGRLQDELDRHRIDDLDLLDTAEEERRERVRAEVVGMIREERPVDTQFDRLGVEWRPVVEQHTLAQLEGPLGTGLVDRPLGRQTRLRLRLVAVRLDERVEHVVDRAQGVRAEPLGRVEGVDVVLDVDDEFLRPVLAPCELADAHRRGRRCGFAENRRGTGEPGGGTGPPDEETTTVERCVLQVAHVRPLLLLVATRNATTIDVARDEFRCDRPISRDLIDVRCAAV